MTKPTNRHIAYVAVSYDLLLEMLYEDYEIKHGIKCTKGIPKDAEFISSYFDFEKGCAYLLFGHESFDNVPLGKKIPVLEVQWTADFFYEDLSLKIDELIDATNKLKSDIIKRLI